MLEEYDIIVIGGGHAGCEAALASARLGFRILLVCVREDRIGWMPCNPSIGGPAKGHLTREIDALGGMQALVTDSTCIHIRWLNTRKGPAVRALRAQCDKLLYASTSRHFIQSEPKISVLQGIVTDLIIIDDKVTGIVVDNKRKISAKAVVLATGTFLGGMIFRGDERIAAGREGESPATELAVSLKKSGLPLGRLKTGTPPRVRKDSIDFSSLEIQKPDPSHPSFSFITKTPNELPRLPCYITHTTQETCEIITSNFHRAALFSGDISGPGPRYCPSIEDKYRKFPDKIEHPVFLEPESITPPLSDEIYLQGLSTSLPSDVQDMYVRSIPGLENAEIVRYGYAIEYDYVDPTAVTTWTALKNIPNLFLAGNILGTTGYEEAAGLGLLAGINAALFLKGQEPFILRRDQAYLGVMTDDLATRGVIDPYRMLSGRAEWRLLLRFDNADLRLTPLGREIGLVDDNRWNIFIQRKKEIEALIEILNQKKARLNDVPYSEIETPRTQTLSEWLKIPGISIEALIKRGFIDQQFQQETLFTVEAEIKYEGYLKRQLSDIKRIARAEYVKIPDDLSYEDISAISHESREKLGKIRPRTLGQAARISGVKPSDIAVLEIILSQRAAH